MSALIAAPILLPLLGAALSIGLGRSRLAQQIIGVITLGAAAAATAPGWHPAHGISDRV